MKESLIVKNLKANYLNTIQSEVNNLSLEKLYTLFHVIFYSNCQSHLYMSEESHLKFVQSYYQHPTIRKPEIFKSFLIQSIKEYVFEYKYPLLLSAIDLINEDFTFEELTSSPI